MNMIVGNFMQMHFNIFKCGPACPHNICVECGSLKLTQISEQIRQGFNNCLSTGRKPSSGSQLFLQISANSVRNIITAKSLHKSREQFASRRKISTHLEPGSVLGYTSILMHFFQIYNVNYMAMMQITDKSSTLEHIYITSTSLIFLAY